MKKYLIVLLVALMISFANAQNIGAFLQQNPALVDRQINCVLRRAPCDALGNQLIGYIPEIANGCRRCTPQQAAAANQLVGYIRATRPDAYQQILAMYGGRG